jgi:paraquat-inducible protein B
VAGSLVYNRRQDLGPTITITLRDASGVKPDQTEIRYRGVPVGQVTTIELGPYQERVAVTAWLRRTAAGPAREGSLFWIVRPEYPSDTRGSCGWARGSGSPAAWT